MALIDIGSAKQLFVDDYLIESMTNTRQIMNPAEKAENNPVVRPEHPWEGNCVITWGSVLFDAEEKLFKVWYEAYKKFPRHGDGTIVCYATSKDGLRWEKPKLGLYDYLGSKANNIVFWLKGKGIDAPTVFRVPNPTPEVKYRMYFHQFGNRVQGLLDSLANSILHLCRGGPGIGNSDFYFRWGSNRKGIALQFWQCHQPDKYYCNHQDIGGSGMPGKIAYHFSGLFPVASVMRYIFVFLSSMGSRSIPFIAGIRSETAIRSPDFKPLSSTVKCPCEYFILTERISRWLSSPTT